MNGERSVTEIWEVGASGIRQRSTTSSDPWKFAYVVTPETLDIALPDIVASIEAMAQAGMVELVRR